MPWLAATIRIPSLKPDLDAALEGLVQLNLALMRQHAKDGNPVPPLGCAGVHWQPDSERGKPAETWDSIDVVRKRGYGDCEDLASWLAAEYRYKRHIFAKAVVRPSRTPGVAWHCVVDLPGGQTLDPSAKLGMYAYHDARIAGGTPAQCAAAAAADVAKRRECGPGTKVASAGGPEVGRDLARALRAVDKRVSAWATRIEQPRTPKRG